MSRPDGGVDETKSLIRAFAILGGFFFVAIASAYAFLLSPGQAIPRDPSSLVVGRDFLNFWMYGQAAFSPMPWLWYDVSLYQAEIAKLLGPGYPGVNWSYPPNIML